MFRTLARPVSTVLPLIAEACSLQASSLLDTQRALDAAQPLSSWKATFSSGSSHQEAEGWQRRDTTASASSSSHGSSSSTTSTGIFPGHASPQFNQLYTAAPAHADASSAWRQPRRSSSQDWADAAQDGTFDSSTSTSSSSSSSTSSSTSSGSDSMAKFGGAGADASSSGLNDDESARASWQMAQYMRKSSLGELRRRMLMHKSRMRPVHVASALYCLQRLQQEQRAAAAAPSRHERGGLHGTTAAAVTAEAVGAAARLGGPPQPSPTGAAGAAGGAAPPARPARKAPAKKEGGGAGFHRDDPEAPHHDPNLLLVQQMLGELAYCVWQQLGDFSAEELATVLHAWARLGWHPDAALLVAVKRAMLSPHILARASAQDLSMALWALAKLEALDGDSLEAATPGVEALLSGFSAQGLTTTAWAVAQAGPRPASRALAAQLAGRFVELLMQSNSGNVQGAQAERGAGSLGGSRLGLSLTSQQQWQQWQQQQQQPQQMGAQQDAPASAAGTGKLQIAPRDVSGMMHALARLGAYPHSEFRALCDCMSQHADDIPLRVLCSAVWAAGELRHWDHALMTAALDAAAAREAEMTARDAVELCKALAVFACVGPADGGVAPERLERLAGAVTRCAPGMGMGDAATASWALLGVLGLHERQPLLSALAAQVGARWRACGAPNHWDACLLFVTQLALDAAGCKLPLLPRGPDSSVSALAACEAAWREDVRRALLKGATSSGVSRAALALLEAAGVQALPRQMTPDGLFVVDALVPDFEGRGPVAIVENTDGNYVRNVARYGSVVTGATALRDRLLAARGYRVVAVTKRELEHMQPQDVLEWLQGTGEGAGEGDDVDGGGGSFAAAA